jgi:hypothetical protein
MIEKATAGVAISSRTMIERDGTPNGSAFAPWHAVWIASVHEQPIDDLRRGICRNSAVI